MLGKAAELFTLALLATLVPRILGPAAYGQFALALTVVTLGSLAMTLGGPTVMARFVPSAAPELRPALARALGARLARGRAVGLAIVAVAAGVLVVVWPDRFPVVPTTLVVSALAMSVGATLALQAGLGLGRTGMWSARYAVHNAVLVAAALVLGSAAGAVGAIAAICIASGAALLLALASVARPLRSARRGAEIPRAAMRFGAVQAAGGALTQLVHRGAVVAVAALGASSAETGFAALALGLALPAVYVIHQLFLVSLPERSEQGARDLAGAERALRRLAVASLAVAAPAAALGALASGPAVALVLGDDFRRAAEPLVPALAMVAFAPMTALANHAAALRLRPAASAWSGLLGAGALVATSVAAVPVWGAAGGTAAALVGAATAALAAAALLPGAVGADLTAASVGSAAAVLAIGALA